MAKDPAVLFYTSDFLTGTSRFTMEQRGQYITLLCDQHQNGHIPEEHMIFICRTLDSPVLKKFVKDDDGLFFNERMEDEHNKRKAFSKSRSINRKGKKKNTRKTSVNHMIPHMENENENENKDGIEAVNKDKEFHDFFEKARKIYPGKKRGHKTELENFIKKHKDWKQASEVMESSVVEQIADKEKRADAGLFVAEWKNFGTWINQRCWEEEPGEIKCPSNKNQSRPQFKTAAEKEADDIDRILGK